jgi:predicted secreted hydrolase
MYPTTLKLFQFIGFLILSVLLASCNQSQLFPESSQTASPRLSDQDIEGFKRAENPIPLTFPKDQGAHPEYLTEWWYYTGNLDTTDGRHFGYQLTFFRRALIPETERRDRESSWATNQVYLAHFALTDVGTKNFYAFERFARGAVGLAGSISPPFQVWLHDWKVEQIAADTYHLEAEENPIHLDLILHDQKGPILNGNKGYSQKGPQAGNASIYISQTRLLTAGTLRIDLEEYEVQGLSWMDHEFSTSALSDDQVGWDWFALQLDNSRELMVFYLRRQDGSVDLFSSGTYVDIDGSTTPLTREDFSIEVLDTWRSPHSKAEYPAHWRIRVPSLDIDLEVIPYISDQELNLTFTYWEGAVKIQGLQNGEAVSGNGYVELTGYSGAFAGDF